jgi:uncharacterized membrane protein YvbJ
MEPQALCPHCKGSTSPSDIFCPTCGKKLKDAAPSISLISQILIYSLSFFLPPLGLWPGIKYLKQSDQKSKKIGWAAIILTVISTVLTIYICMYTLDSFSKYYGNQAKIYQDLNF